MSYPFLPPLAAEPVDSIAHVIQIALTPVFMLSGIGTLLNLFNTRLARVSDHLEEVDRRLTTETADKASIRKLYQHRARLHRRVFTLDSAIMMGAVGGAATCGAAFVMFLGSLRDSSVAIWLLILFGTALSCTIGALAAFCADSLLGWHGLRREGTLPKP